MIIKILFILMSTPIIYLLLADNQQVGRIDYAKHIERKFSENEVSENIIDAGIRSGNRLVNVFNSCKNDIKNDSDFVITYQCIKKEKVILCSARIDGHNAVVRDRSCSGIISVSRVSVGQYSINGIGRDCNVVTTSMDSCNYFYIFRQMLIEFYPDC